MELLEKAEKQLVFLRKMELEIQEQLRGAPKESLQVSKSNGVFQYYIFKNGKHSYIRKKNLQLARAIAQKDYNKKMETYIKKNILALKTFMKHYTPQKCENYFLKMPAARRVLIAPFFLDKETYAKQWQARKYDPKKDQPEGNFYTKKDEHVRSKSEVIIADTLGSKRIPYHYEAPLKINSNLTLYPDFLCLNKRTRQEFYWEHCGMMDDFEYSGNLATRLSIYAQKNIILGKNLILTMETRKQQLNTKDIEKVIEALLV